MPRFNINLLYIQIKQTAVLKGYFLQKKSLVSISTVLNNNYTILMSTIFLINWYFFSAKIAVVKVVKIFSIFCSSELISVDDILKRALRKNSHKGWNLLNTKTTIYYIMPILLLENLRFRLIKVQEHAALKIHLCNFATLFFT